VELALVESQLLTLEDVTIAAAGLAGTAGDDSVETTSLELLLQSGVNLARGGKASSLLLLDAVALLNFLDGLTLLHLATTTEGLAVVSLVPLTERRGIDLDDGRLGKGVGADELVVGRVVWGPLSAISSAYQAMGSPNSQVTTITRVLRVTPSEAQAKLPESRRRARCLWLPPRVRTVWTRLAPIRVPAGWRPASKALFFPAALSEKSCLSKACVQDQNARGRLPPPAECRDDTLPSGPSSYVYIHFGERDIR